MKCRDKRRDLDFNLYCKVCGKRGLRYRSKTGICAACLRELPYMVKTNGTTSARVILQNYATYMIGRFGVEHSARLLEVNVEVLGAISRGEDVFAAPEDGQRRSTSLTGLPEDIVRMAMARYEDLRPLEPALAGLVGPYRASLKIALAEERSGPRQQRLNRAKDRADRMCHVPHHEASLDPAVEHNAFGQVTRSGRRRCPMPMRVCVGLWCLGFGAPAIASIAARTRWPASKSSVTRLIKQSQRPFSGAVEIKGAALAMEVAQRPLLHVEAQRERRRPRDRQC